MEPTNEPVAWQYRWLNPSGDKVPESMLRWEPCEPNRAVGQTMENLIQELRSYESDGKPQYEVRALWALPPEVHEILVRCEKVIADNGLNDGGYSVSLLDAIRDAMGSTAQ